MTEKQRDRHDDAVMSGDAARSPEPEPPSSPRTATSMAPGIPTGSGRGIDEALRQPDTEIGGGVARDTTPATAGGISNGKDSADGDDVQKRDPRDVRTEDRDRTTL